MLLKEKEKYERKTIEENSSILSTNQKVNHLIQIHDGLVEVINPKFAPNRKLVLYTLVQEANISLKSKNSIIGIAQLIQNSPLNINYIAKTSVSLSAYPITSFKLLLQARLDTGLFALKSLYMEVMYSYKMIQKLINYNNQLSKIMNSYMLLIKKRLGIVFKTNSNTVDNIFKNISLYEKNVGKYPEFFNVNWLNTDHLTQFKINNNFVSKFSSKIFQECRNELSLNISVLEQKSKSDPKFLDNLSKNLSELLIQNINEIIFLQDEIESKIDILFVNKQSCKEKLLEYKKLVSSEKNLEKEYNEVSQYFVQIAEHFFNLHQMILDEVHPNYEEVINFLSQHIKTEVTSNKILSNKNETQKIQVSDGEALKSLTDAPTKIMEAVGCNDEEKKIILEGLAKLKQNANPIDPNSDFRKLRRQITTTFWKVWEKAIELNRLKRGQVPKEVQLMLYYGFFDKDFIEETHARFIINRHTDNFKSKFPIIHAVDWMQKIYDRIESPSIDELGQSYFDRLKLDNKASWKKEEEIPKEIDTNKFRVQYEINGFLELNNRLTSGSPSSYLPFLNKYQLTSQIDKVFVSKELLNEKINQILNIDYTAFHREIIYNNESIGILKEFIQKQIYPYFIIIPSIGTKIMMWQELSGRNKSSHGRIVIPSFAIGDLTNMVLLAIAAFRWELTKSVMGADWNNMSLSSITSDYTDYIQFFKKNKDLSIEVKEKLSSEFKRFRSDRDRFANDYLNWILYESKGAPKLNKVVRNIFYKHVPFSKAIRDNLSKQPAFIEIHNRFKNIRTAKYNQLETRYRKFGELLVPELKENLEFYKV